MKIRTVILAALLGTAAMNSMAQSVIDQGFCGANAGGGKNLTWTFYSDGTLTIYGSGQMGDFTSDFTGEDIAPWRFYRSQINTIIIGDSVTDIGYIAFAECINLTSITIPNSVTAIRGYAFSLCNILTSVTIGNSVTRIEYGAFWNCINLTSLTIHAVTPPALPVLFGDNAFSSVSDTISIYVPCGSISAYQTATGWRRFNNYFGMGFTDTTFIFDTICYGIVYNDNDFSITEGTGIYYRTIPSVYQCDSVICLTLEEYPFVPITNYFDTIYYDETYSDANFTNLTEAGTYYDTLKSSNGCDSLVCLTLWVKGEGITNYKLQITNYKLQITNYKLQITSDELPITNYEIYDAVGKKLQSEIVNLQFEIVIDISHFAKGIYFIKINNQINNQINKFIKF